MNATNIHEKLSSKEYCSPEKMRVRYPMNIHRLPNSNISLETMSSIFSLFVLFRLISSFAAFRRCQPRFLPVGPATCCQRRGTCPFEAMYREFGLTAEEGGRHIVYGVTAGQGNAEEEEKLEGEYIHFSQVIEESNFVLSDAGCEMQNRFNWIRRDSRNSDQGRSPCWCHCQGVRVGHSKNMQ
ncbi:hypothetical protein C8J56DRAFT_458482 [Mycena floridula]|nr:hypothetical protein C8J56DRAFT_458482 [Mycena floridula]